MKKIICLILLSASIAPILGQSDSVYVDFDKVVEFLPEGIEAKRKLKKKTQAFEDSLALLTNSYQRFIMTQPCHIQKLDSIQIAHLLSEIKSMEENISDYMRIGSKSIQKSSTQYRKSLEQIIQSKWRDYCIENNIEKALIVDTSDVNYQEFNMTHSFIKFLEKQ